MSVTLHRSAAEIGHTELGPRPLPPLGKRVTGFHPTVVDTVIANGLRVVAVHMPTVPLVETRLLIPFSGTDVKHTARAELLAETLLAGTHRRDRMQIDMDLAVIGGVLGASVDPEQLSIRGSALASGFSTLLDVLADVVTSATYPDAEISRERDRLIERVTLARSQPETIAREALQRHRYGEHPFAREMPEQADVADTSSEEVRALHRTGVVPRGSLLLVVGDIDPDSAITAISEAFAGWSSTSIATVLPPLPILSGGKLAVIDRPGAVQSQIRLSAQAIPLTDQRYPALQLANLVFGGFFSSRLVENIREDKGYTYGARSIFEFTLDAATILINADTASDVTAAALWETHYELGRIGLVPPTPSEVDTAREYAIGSLLLHTGTQSGFIAHLAALIQVGLDADWLRVHPERLAAVTGEQVAEAAAEFFAPSAYTGVVVGDAKLLEPQLRTLGV